MDVLLCEDVVGEDVQMMSRVYTEGVVHVQTSFDESLNGDVARSRIPQSLCARRDHWLVCAVLSWNCRLVL